jgi:hypothetical protein
VDDDESTNGNDEDDEVDDEDDEVYCSVRSITSSSCVRSSCSSILRFEG